MSSDPLQDEVDRLRSEVASYRQREMEEIHASLARARADADHYRNEAHRNAELGRKIAMEYQKQITELRAELEVLRKASAGAARARITQP